MCLGIWVAVSTWYVGYYLLVNSGFFDALRGINILAEGTRWRMHHQLVHSKVS
jgi:hypothetical protein